MNSHIINADKYSQKSIRELLDKVLFDIETSKLEDIKIACAEVVQNIVRHGYQFKSNQIISIAIEKSMKTIKIEFEDSAETCDPSIFINNELVPGEKGLMGIPIIKKLSKNFSIDPLPNGNLTTITFDL
jgi:anti-sigma regulatory factor (Ser/Thr protein kinase)